ncbi:MAG: hypothetical protein IKN17_06555 [Ruminococcus sp.]|nr:hypothetical protein [Ruminococcus sp.]
MAQDIKIIDGDYTGKPPRPVKRTVDLLIGGCLFASPLWSGLTYLRITLIAAGFGVVFAVVQYILNRGEPSSKVRKVSMGLRIFAGVVLALCMVLITGMDSGMKSLYSVRKSLYCLGNGVDSEQLSFMPDSIPSGAEDYSMRFIPSASEGIPGARIHFTADEEGVKELRETALAKGGTLVEADSFVHKKLRVYCEEQGRSIGDAEVYSMGEYDRQCPAYLVDPETGFCVIYW